MPVIKFGNDSAIENIRKREVSDDKLELYRLLDEGEDAVRNGRTRSLENVISNIKQQLVDGRLP